MPHDSHDSLARHAQDILALWRPWGHLILEAVTAQGGTQPTPNVDSQPAQRAPRLARVNSRR
ncbi:hypothetical protein [Haliangium ochraceum]|uniref:hypothetical protein n=1 Tax=Haliangium ochraceum TaxID=80816 RepID=UPI00126A0D90|nr:hypothetical protein [Haliangium ochraceum]